MIQKLKGRLVEIENRMTEISKEAEQALLTVTQKEELSKLQAEHAELRDDLKLREGIQNSIQGTSQPRPKVDASPRAARSLIETGPAYKHMGTFLQDVMKADYRTGHGPDRLLNAVSSAGVEGTNANGGFAVPADLRREIQEKVLGEESLLSRCDRYGTFSNVLTFPVDIVNPWSTTYGAADISLPETGSYSEVTPSLSQTSVSVGKLGVACSVSEELMEDALAMGSFVSKKLGERLQDRINFALISGSGANNTPNGFLLAGNKLTVATGSADVSGTVRISGEDIVNMFYSVPAAQRADAVWLISDSVEPYLVNVKFSGSTLFARPGDFVNGFTTNTLMGKPVLVMPQMAAIGNAGDIAFVSFKQYLAVTKGDVATDVTPYVYWLNDVQTFKAHIRIGGKSWLAAKYTMGDGSSRSPFVTLAGGR